jgi:D-3-phosphoglycerate dehydrogenase
VGRPPHSLVPGGRALILVAEFMAEEGLRVLRSFRETRYEPDLWRQPVRLRVLASEAAALVVRNLTPVDGGLLAAAPRLQVVGRLGVGLDNIDLAAARRHGVAVVYAPGANAVATAEFTLTLCLALARRLIPAAAAAASGRWEREAFAGCELAGRVLGVLGLGRIGRLVARRARALGMDVWAYHPSRGADDPEVRELGVRLVEREQLFRSADFVSLHLPLTAETRHLVGQGELALMRPDAFLINTARGGLVDERALARALREGWIAGAALDVREGEPPPRPDPLEGVPNLILTPHVAGLSREALRLTSLAVADDVVRVLRGQRPLHPAG